MNNVLKLTLVFSVALLLQNCAIAPVENQPIQTPVSNCAMVEETIVLRNQTVKLPTTGKFVLESHLATKSDFGGGFPTTNTQGIDTHIANACKLIKGAKPGCSDVYTTRYHKEWTPPEGGKAGQGSVGNLKPTVLEEMWSGNMYWKVKPAPGTKFLACNRASCVVTIVGFETGPLDPKWLGGLQGEVMWALKASSSTTIRWGRLKDQTLAPGPVDCK